MQTFLAWLLFAIIVAIFLWGLWTLVTGAFKLVNFLTTRRDPRRSAMQSMDYFSAGQDAIPIPPWVYGRPGRRCAHCAHRTIVLEHEPGREAMLCPICGAYGIVYSDMIEWEIPNEGLLVETLDPSSP